MNKDTTNLINHSTSTFLNIAQMAQYRVRYVLNKDAVDKEKMYKHAFLSVVGIACLFTIGIAGLIESRNNY